MIKVKCVLVLFLCFGICFSQQQNGNNNNNNVNYNKNNNNNNNFSADGPFLPEQTDRSREYRPCPDFDIRCIRKFFADHSKYCSIATKGVPEPVYREESTLFFSSFNITVTQYGVEIFGLNGKVTEFYVNEETDRVVLQVSFNGVDLRSKLDVYRYDRAGRFPAITKSYSRVQFSSFRTTTTFLGIDKLDLRTSVTSGYIDKTPTIFVNPSAGVHPDPSVQGTFARFVSMPNIVVQEAFLTSAPFYGATFVQCAICDYGLKLK